MSFLKKNIKFLFTQAKLGISIILLWFFFPLFTNARSYPIKEITFNNCNWDGCTIELPIIKNADYFSYRNNAGYRRVYSMLWLATYFERWDVGIGSHQGIDIATTTGTPVYASYDGEVIVAGRKGDRGNVVVIKHVWNNQILYTTYAHLSHIDVEVGDVVEEGHLIGKVGDTGNTTGPHLHFQIETNQDSNHPYFPKWCAGSIDEIVNEGTCFSQVRENTLDPILFLEQTVKLWEKSTQQQGSIYIDQYAIELSGFVGWFLETNEVATLTLSQRKGSWWEFLKEPISFSFNDQLLSVSPSKIQSLGGERKVFLQSNEWTGLVLFEVKYGDKRLTYLPILINDKEWIEKWKQNEKLIIALELLGISI